MNLTAIIDLLRFRNLEALIDSYMATGMARADVRKRVKVFCPGGDAGRSALEWFDLRWPEP